MSRAGKFIPGGGGKGARTGPIRAPDPSAPPPDPGAPAGGTVTLPGKKPFGKGSLVKPVSKNQRMPIVIMSGICCCLLVSAGWYTLAYLPAQRQIAAMKQQIADQAAAAEALKEKTAAEEAARKLREATERGVFTADSNPPGATITMGDSRGMAPVKFTNLIPGNFTVTVHLDGYEDYKKDVTVGADQPTDLGTITLEQEAGNLALTSPQSGVTYTITGPNDYTHDGTLPDKLDKLPMGDYSVVATESDWKLPAIPITIHDHDNIQKDIKFPYANVSITSVPTGATVRDGNKVLGQTPLSLTQVRPRDFQMSVDLPPYTVQRQILHVPDFGNVIKQVTLTQGKDFIASNGMPMVWVPDGNLWVGKYQVRQVDFEAVGGSDPSTFRRPNRPVDTVTWDAASAWVDQLNDFERKANKLPAGYHYSLPKESQWEMFSADANLDLAATSRINPLTATQDVGFSEPNKYGIYDSIGNVWEWCLDDYDANGNHSLRGGCWLSSQANFPNAETRQGAPAKYADKFIGFRVVLVPN